MSIKIKIIVFYSSYARMMKKIYGHSEVLTQLQTDIFLEFYETDIGPIHFEIEHQLKLFVFDMIA